MSDAFFEHPILNSPYEYPKKHWELDEQGQPTHRVLETRRPAEFITPIPKPRKRKAASSDQEEIVFDEGKGISTAEQQYDPTSNINDIRSHVETWRNLPSSGQWQVTPETARLLQHWRSHKYSSFRPFFCPPMPAATDLRKSIQAVLREFPDRPLALASRAFLGPLGYRSDRTLDLGDSNPGTFLEYVRSQAAGPACPSQVCRNFFFARHGRFPPYPNAFPYIR